MFIMDNLALMAVLIEQHIFILVFERHPVICRNYRVFLWFFRNFTVVERWISGLVFTSQRGGMILMLLAISATSC